jgi:hypothetical protein
MLPAALALAVINQQAFASIEQRIMERKLNEEAAKEPGSARPTAPTDAGSLSPRRGRPPLPRLPAASGCGMTCRATFWSTCPIRSRRAASSPPPSPPEPPAAQVPRARHRRPISR